MNDRRFIKDLFVMTELRPTLERADGDGDDDGSVEL